jgi:hypothetical protein
MANTASLLAAEQLPEKEEAKKHSRSHPHAHSINDSITFRAPFGTITCRTVPHHAIAPPLRFVSLPFQHTQSQV